MSVLCPCCNRPMEAPFAPISALWDAPMQPQERVLIKALADAYPRAVNIEHLIDALYFDDPNGGADSAYNLVNVRLYHLRRKLPAYGWTIPSAKRGTGSHGRYRLEPLNAERPAA